jgi:hypothetical protein
MNKNALILWHSFLQAAPSLDQNALANALQPDLLEEIKTSPAVSLEGIGTLPPEEELDHIHYSWFSPFLRTLPEREIKLFLASLTSIQVKGLKQSLLLSNTLPSLSLPGKTYLKQVLLTWIAKEEPVPTYCLPPNPINHLLDLTTQELLSLIDLLSMHDLSVEIRQIIDTTKLKHIYSLLTKAQTSFLKTLLHKKEPLSFKKIGLQNWQGDLDMLSAMLTQRGINRIAKALYPYQSSLAWHVAHRLEIGKGQLLLKLCAPLDHPKACTVLKEQVVELINAFKPL